MPTTTTRKVIYKNHCSPQEQIFASGRYYLDSDCGRKLSGSGNVDANTSIAYVAEIAVTDVVQPIANEKDFVFVKNTGGGSGNDLLVSFVYPSPEYLTVLSSGESLAVELRSSNNVDFAVAKCAPGEDTTMEYLNGII